MWPAPASRKSQHRVVIPMSRERDLPQMILALTTTRRFTCGLDGRQQQRDKHADDGNHDEELDERKTGADTTHDGPSKQCSRETRVGRDAWYIIVSNPRVYL